VTLASLGNTRLPVEASQYGRSRRLFTMSDGTC